MEHLNPVDQALSLIHILMTTLSASLGITSDNFLVRLLLDQTPMVYLAYGLVIFTVIYFNRTKSGLNYKAVGEYPRCV